MTIQRTPGCLALLALGLAACGSIGDGVEPVSMELQVGGASEDAETFECLAGNARALVTFSDGRVGDFVRRAEWESDNPSVLTVSDGSFTSEEGQFLNGSLLPLREGTATLTARYLNFEESIRVNVRPTKIEISPADQTIAQGSRLQLQATGILDGQTSLRATSLASLGLWSVEPQGAEAVTEIDLQSGILSAEENVAGTDTVRFRVDFCDRTTEVAVNVVDQAIETLSLRHEDDLDTPVTAITLAPDASQGLRAIAGYSGGLSQDITGSVSFNFTETDVVFSALRGIGVVSSFFSAGGRQTQLTAQFDPDGTVEGDEILSQTVSIDVLDVALDPDSLEIAPLDALVLPETGIQYQATATFSGTGGDLVADLTRDVRWTSSDLNVATIGNVNGARGFAFGVTDATGQVEIGAVRQSEDAPATVPTTSLTIGSEDGEDDLVLTALSLGPAEATLNRGDVLALSATGTLENSNRSDIAQDLTTAVVWSSSDESLAVVGNANGSKGLVRALSDAPDQSVTITARFFDQALQPDAVVGTLELTLNPSSP